MKYCNTTIFNKIQAFLQQTVNPVSKKHILRPRPRICEPSQNEREQRSSRCPSLMLFNSTTPRVVTLPVVDTIQGECYFLIIVVDGSVTTK